MLATFTARGPTAFLLLKISGKVNEDASRKVF